MARIYELTLMEFNVAAKKAYFTLSNTRNASVNLLNIHQH